MTHYSNPQNLYFEFNIFTRLRIFRFHLNSHYCTKKDNKENGYRLRVRMI